MADVDKEWEDVIVGEMFKLVKRFLACWKSDGVEIEDYLKAWLDVLEERRTGKVAAMGEKCEVYYIGRRFSYKSYNGAR